MRGRKVWRTIASVENFLRPLQKSHFGDQNVFLLQFQYKTTLANCNKASIKKSSAHHSCSPLNRPTPDFYTAISGRWVIILKFQGAFYRPPWTLWKQMFRRGRQVFQVGQAPSGPTVIRPLITLVSSTGFPSDKLAFTNAHSLAIYYGIQYLTVWRNNKRIFQYIFAQLKTINFLYQK